MIEREDIAYRAFHTVRSYRRFVTAGRYTWAEAIARRFPQSYPEEIPAVEAAILAALARGETPSPFVSALHEPGQADPKSERAHSRGRRVIRSTKPFS
jgi:hypothetical protein